MCGDIPGYKRPSKVSRASAAVCLKLPCTRLGSVIHNMIHFSALFCVSVARNMPVFMRNLEFIGVLAEIVFHVSEEGETQ